jgi:excinuclease ABC subunit C
VAAVQLFQMRAGKLVGRLGYMADAKMLGADKRSTQAIATEEADQATAKTPPEILSDPSSGVASTTAGEPSAETLAPADVAVGLILQRVIEEHYSQVEGVEIPPELLIQVALPQQELIGAWLSELRGRRVKLAVPQRSQKAELIELVVRNASYELQRAQRASEQNQMATEDLAQLLDLEVPPRRIEGFDISHIQGSDAVASQVVFIEGLPAKQHYRKYRIRSSSVHAGHSDDFMAMAEVIRRRFRRWAQAKAEGADLDQLRQRSGSALQTDGMGDWPDVVMIDGGKGQLSAVMEALREMNLHGELTVCSLAKQREEVFVPGARTPLESDPDQLGVALLRRLRDEAHRFAVSYHRQQRGERMKRSRLSDIPGLGPKRVKELLAHFRSVDAIQLATPEQIAAAPGVGLALARQIWGYFHPEPEPWEQEQPSDQDAFAVMSMATPTLDSVGETIQAARGSEPGKPDSEATTTDGLAQAWPTSGQTPCPPADLKLAL